jgi:hypothetical protein
MEGLPMIEVTWWLDDEFPNMHFWNASVVGQPEVNSTGRSLEQMQALIVEAYNRVNGTSVTEADFTWTEVPRP